MVEIIPRRYLAAVQNQLSNMPQTYSTLLLKYEVMLKPGPSWRYGRAVVFYPGVYCSIPGFHPLKGENI